jgi:two-component system chemotaxis sensor kinase CheA
VANPVNLGDFVAGFLLEAEEHLHSVSRNLVAASDASKRNAAEPKAVRELFRSIHTIKGLAAMVGADPIVEITHEMEALLRDADRSGGRIGETALDAVLQGVRAVEERVRAIGQGGISSAAKAPAPLLEVLQAAQGIGAAPKLIGQRQLKLSDELIHTLSTSDTEQLRQAANNGFRAVVVEFHPSPEKAAQGTNITAVRARLTALGEIVKVLPKSSKGAPTGISFQLVLSTKAKDAELIAAVDGDSSSVFEIQAEEAPSAAEAGPAEPIPSLDAALLTAPETEWLNADQASIRVDVRRLDEALEQLSSLFVNRFKLDRVAAELASRGADIRELKSVLAENSRQLRRLRGAISEARMVPLSELLQRLPLVVRGITKNSEKLVNVVIQAGTAEVDKAVADKIFPAVVHLVRNAVDHALETKAERRDAGKAETGELRIECDDSSGTNLVLTIRDDGRGINREAVARKLGRPIARSDEELLQQICAAGLSTSTAVTTTSGRGMGMDIVQRTVDVLGGTLKLNTSEGKGTTFTMRVPVTITIVDVLGFQANGQIYVAPMAVVDEIVDIDPSLVVEMPSPLPLAERPRLVQHRGRSIPFFTLSNAIGSSTCQKIPTKALVVNQGKGSVAFGVDRLMGKQEAVVRPLDDALIRVTGMAGATDLGDGKPTLVLDLPALGQSLLATPAVLS